MNFRNASSVARSAVSGSSRNRVRAVLVTGALVAVPVAGLVTATGASAASGSTWDAVAACESTNNWSANTGNGFSGGLQFTPSTWAAYGGSAYASSADQASKAQQIAVAQNVLASQGPGAWPVCGPKAGLSSSDTTTSSSASSSSTSGTGSSTGSSTSGSTGTSSHTGSTGTGTDTSGSVKAGIESPGGWHHSTTPTTSSTGTSSASGAHTSSAHTSGGGYTVKAGDTLGAIAAAHGTTWQALYSANHTTIGADANTIYPGQTLTIG